MMAQEKVVLFSWRQNCRRLGRIQVACWLSGEPVKQPSSEYIWSTFEVLQKLSDEGIDVTFEGVKSHSGLALHDLADRLAREASVVNEENLYGHYLPPGRLFLRYKSC